MRKILKKNIEETVVILLALIAVIFTNREYICSNRSNNVTVEMTQNEETDDILISGLYDTLSYDIGNPSPVKFKNDDIPIVFSPMDDANDTEEVETTLAYVEPYTMYVGWSWLNIRSSPNTDDDNIIGTLKPGTEIKVVGYDTEMQDWVLIEYEDSEAYVYSEYIQESNLEASTYNYDWTGEKLNRRNGIVSGPSGNETYYNLNMSRCVYYMNRLGYYEEVWTRSDGVKMFGPYVMVAADLSIRPKGTLVETTLGTGIVVDTGEFANWDSTRLDIAVNW